MLLLTDEYINELADMAVAQTETDLVENTHIPELTEKKAEIEKAIGNITKAIEKGVASDTLLTRLNELEDEKKDIEKQLTIESQYVYIIDKPLVVYWLNQFRNGSVEDEEFRRHIIDLLVNSVTVWDDPDGYKITAAYNLTSCKTKTFRVSKDNGVLLEGSSDLKRSTPPEKEGKNVFSFLPSFLNL